MVITNPLEARSRPHDLQHEYERLRRKGFRASEALRAARINDAFEWAEYDGTLRFEVVYCDEPYDDSYVDTWHDKTETQREHVKGEIRRRVEVDGHTGIRVVRLGENGETVDVPYSVYGFIGNDGRDSGCDVDMKLDALTMIAKTPLHWEAL